MEAWMQRGASATPPRWACSPLGRQPPRRSGAGATARREKRPSPGLRQGRLPRAVTWPRGAMRSRGTRCVKALDEARPARRACAAFRYAAMTIGSSNPVREQVLRRGSFFPSKRSGPVSTSVFEPRSEASLMLSFRPAGPEDARETSTLVRTSFRVVASRDWAPEAVARFLHETSEEEVRRRLQTATFSMLCDGWRDRMRLHPNANTQHDRNAVRASIMVAPRNRPSACKCVAYACRIDASRRVGDRAQQQPLRVAVLPYPWLCRHLAPVRVLWREGDADGLLAAS